MRLGTFPFNVGLLVYGVLYPVESVFLVEDETQCFG